MVRRVPRERTMSHPGADTGICEGGRRCLTFLSSPFLLSLTFLSSLPSLPRLELMPLKPVRRSGGALQAPSVGSGAEPRPKTNFVHSNAVRKLLVAIIVNTLE